MVFRYIPLLRWKSGEKAALAQLSTAGRNNVSPLILLGADNFKDKKATKKAPVVPAVSVFASEIMSAWGPSPFFLDSSPLLAAGGATHPLTSIASQVRAAQGHLIPATTLDAPAAYQQAVGAVAAADQQGVCLRISLAEMTGAAAWLSDWPHAATETDLIVDLGDSAQSVLALGTAVNTAFAALNGGTSWRSVTIAGTSIPENFQGLAAGVYTRPRSEKLVWEQLVASQLPYQLDYGDYATVSTAAPAPNIAWGYPITVKYTLADQFLVCRGVRTTGMGAQDMQPQLRSHAQSIVAHPGRGPLAQCWADDRIDKIANGTGEPKGLPHWVSLSVNRHIEIVRSVLP